MQELEVGAEFSGTADRTVCGVWRREPCILVQVR